MTFFLLYRKRDIILDGIPPKSKMQWKKYMEVYTRNMKGSIIGGKLQK